MNDKERIAALEAEVKRLEWEAGKSQDKTAEFWLGEIEPLQNKNKELEAEVEVWSRKYADLEAEYGALNQKFVEAKDEWRKRNFDA